jgi:hypothetical protein
VRSSSSSNYRYTGNRNNPNREENNFFRVDFNDANGYEERENGKEASSSSSSSSSSYYGANVGGWSGGARETRQEEDDRLGGWYSGDESEARERRAGAASASQSRQRGSGGASEYEDEEEPPQASTSHASLGLWPLRQEELLELFPLSGTPGQYSYYWGSWDEAAQRIGLSLLITLLTTNSNTILAAGAFSYCVWGPILQSMVRNLSVKKYPYGGFWEASILDLNFTNEMMRGKGSKRQRRNQQKQKQADSSFSYGYANSNNYNRAVNTTILRVGEVGLADVVVEIPYDISHETLRLGDPALLIVVSNSPSLNSFKAVRDIFLPETRQWLYEYPFVSRRGFKQIADRVSFMKSNTRGERTTF